MVLCPLAFGKQKMSETPNITLVPVLSLTNLRRISKVKVVIFLMVLTLIFLIMASFDQSKDNKGQHSRAAAEISSNKNSIDMKQLMKLIHSKLEYTPRKVPDEKDVIEMDSDLFSVVPRHFLPGVKNPCWYEEISSEHSTDPYKNSRYCHPSKTLCNRMRPNFQKHLQHKDGKLFRLRCLPYFYIVGQPKCGTTDLYSRLKRHQEVQYSIMKESQWWNRRRFGYVLIEDGFKGIVPVKDYLDLFDFEAQHIQEEINRNSSGDHHMTQFIGVEASPSVMWNNIAWSHVHKDRKETEPGFLTQDFIHALQPGAKIIMILRDPVERIYSSYLYSRHGRESLMDFHQKAVESVKLFQSCLSKLSIRACAYKGSLYSAMPLKINIGLYVVFLLDWLTVFHQDQILVLRLEDYSANMRATLQRAFDFLGLSPLSVELEEEVMKKKVSNSRGKSDKSLGPMLPATRDLLREFYQPFNRKLASLLDNNAFLWSYP